ncbi:hypothetical protein PR048_025493 [Dryococelus australis]|uniref:Secreted protein n=1 Tax=Dryococelus australis TaxID=614101 RepID=A0ABQ9GRJ3_9NEOP|nr:hypothetical protein PR048_025493 [Dryococelus australis]
MKGIILMTLSSLVLYDSWSLWQFNLNIAMYQRRELRQEVHTAITEGNPDSRRQMPSLPAKVAGRWCIHNYRWLGQYNHLPSPTFSDHISIEYCNLVKCIQCICKYINKVGGKQL